MIAVSSTALTAKAYCPTKVVLAAALAYYVDAHRPRQADQPQRERTGRGMHQGTHQEMYR